MSSLSLLSAFALKGFYFKLWKVKLVIDHFKCTRVVSRYVNFTKISSFMMKRLVNFQRRSNLSNTIRFIPLKKKKFNYRSLNAVSLTKCKLLTCLKLSSHSYRIIPLMIIMKFWLITHLVSSFADGEWPFFMSDVSYFAVW